jgi:predicted  nucleic acid-binding Zn-ribbon protein
MQAESLEVLEKADVAPVQARAIVRAIEIEIAGAKDTLATKHDLLLQMQDTHQQTDNVRREVAELGATLRAEMAQLRAEVRTEMAGLRTDMAEWRGELRAEIHAAASSGTRQMYMALLGQMAVLLGFAYFFATHVR